MIQGQQNIKQVDYSTSTDNSTHCAVFSLEPLAQDPSRRVCGHALCKPVYPSFSPLFCPNGGLIFFLWLSLCFDHLSSSNCSNFVWGWGKILFRAVLRRDQRVRTGCVCCICVMLVHSCVVMGHRYCLLCREASLSSWI
jgi:hypothetical protein